MHGAGFQRLDAVLNGPHGRGGLLEEGRGRLAGRVRLVMAVAQLEARLCLEQSRGPRPVSLARRAPLKTRETRRVSQARGWVSRLTHSQHLDPLFDIQSF